MNIATLKTMEMADISNMTSKEVKQVGVENVCKVLNKEVETTIWLVYGQDWCGYSTLIGSAANKEAAIHLAKKAAKIAKTDRYTGGIRYEFFIREIPFGGFNLCAYEWRKGDFAVAIKEGSIDSYYI